MGNNTNPRICFACDYCGNQSSEKPSHYARKKRHFCSIGCYSKYRAEILPKEQQHAYKNGGIPIEEKRKRLKARSDLNHAIRDNKISRLPCEGCGNPKTHGHHSDYNQPLKVKWLCVTCHWAEHKKIYENPELLTSPHRTGAKNENEKPRTSYSRRGTKIRQLFSQIRLYRRCKICSIA